MTAVQGFRRPGLWLGAWIAMQCATLVVCLLPMPAVAPPVQHFDKLEHLLGYALLAGYAAMLFATPRALAFAALVLLTLGGLIEVLQSLTAWRSADAGDVGANAVGVALGLCVSVTPMRGLLRWLDRRLA